MVNIQNIWNRTGKYDKMMEKAGIKALKRAVELGAFTQEKLELWLK